VMAAVVLGCEIEGITDSKKLSKKRREELSAIILRDAAAVGIGWVSAQEIDEMGMSAALKECCLRALRKVKVPFHEIILDGTVNMLKGTTLEHYVTTMKKADLLVPSVGAASIVAKVARDKYMAEQDMVFPGYNFSSHSGYGTAAHKKALDMLGPCELHRKSFAPIAAYYSELLAKVPKQPPIRRIFSKSTSSVPAELPTVGSKDQSSKSEESLPKNTGLSQNALSRSKLTTRTVGDKSETEACNHLQRLGYEIVERNWKTKYCEIDIVARKESTLYFVEVKHRKNATRGDGLAALTKKKLNQMKFAAEFYVHVNKLSCDRRLMAISTTGDEPAIEAMLEIS